MVKKIITMQIGKKGLTKEFLQDIKRNFEKYKDLKISVLKSARDDKKQIKGFANEITTFLGPNYISRVIGFTIAIKRLRNPKE